MKLHRRRGEALRQAIFDAVFAQLREVGYGRLTMGAVAAEAGTGKAALYRRWCTKEELVADALRHGLPAPHDAPTHDTVRADLVELLGRLRDALARSRGAGLNAEDGMVREAFTERIVGPCQELIVQALHRGVRRGEVRVEVLDPRVAGKIAAVGPAMLVHHALTGEAAPFDVGAFDVEALVDDVLMRML